MNGIVRFRVFRCSFQFSNHLEYYCTLHSVATFHSRHSNIMCFLKIDEIKTQIKRKQKNELKLENVKWQLWSHLNIVCKCKHLRLSKHLSFFFFIFKGKLRCKYSFGLQFELLASRTLKIEEIHSSSLFTYSKNSWFTFRSDFSLEVLMRCSTMKLVEDDF